MSELDFQKQVQDASRTLGITHNEPDGLLDQLRALEGLLTSLPAAPTEPSLIFRDPAGKIQICAIGSGLIFGRSAECQICFPGHREISKHHFEIQPLQSEFILRDLGSTNGTFVNFDSNAVQQRLLIDGDLIRIAAFRFAFIRAQTFESLELQASSPP